MSPRPVEAGSRGADLRLAGLHVRGGSYALARVELETLAGADALDADGVLDLAEVRWRTGDLAGAEAAAAAWLEEAAGEGGGGTVLANAICAEAAMERGDAETAAAHVESAAAGLAVAGALDALLAGIPARAPWPGGSPVEPVAGSGPASVAPAGIVGPAVGPASGPATEHVAAAVLIVAAATSAAARGVPLTPAADALVAAGATLIVTAPERAAVLLALALRADRGAAEAVLAALATTPSAASVAELEGAAAGSAAPVPAALDARPAPELGDAAAGSTAPVPVASATVAFVRGEALRAAGRHEEARIAYASAERLALVPAETGPSGSPQ